MDVLDLDVELAGGGVLGREVDGREEIAVVRRGRHEDWSLPKGKLEPDRDESWIDAAVREVTEETGYDVDPGEFAGCVSYTVDGRPKVVLFWNMTPVGASRAETDTETDELRWVSVPEALELIDYAEQRTVVARATGRELAAPCGSGPARTGVFAAIRSWRLWPRTTSHRRLSSEFATYRRELTHLIENVARESGDSGVYARPWIAGACSLLEEVRTALEDNDPDRGWRCLHAARRLELFGLAELDRDALLTRARSLARESDAKLGSWRKQAVEDQLGRGDELKDDVTVAEVYEASTLLHGHFDNQYHKIGLLKRQSSMLAVLAFGATAAVLVLHWLGGPLFGPGVAMNGGAFVLTVALFGIIGASVSGFLSLSKAGTGERIPDQILNSWVTFARPTIGAAAALVLFNLLQSGLLDVGQPGAGLAVVVSFAAGSSERLLDRAVRSVEG